jgi:hypothetical protein
MVSISVKVVGGLRKPLLAFIALLEWVWFIKHTLYFTARRHANQVIGVSRG